MRPSIFLPSRVASSMAFETNSVAVLKLVIAVLSLPDRGHVTVDESLSDVAEWLGMKVTTIRRVAEAASTVVSRMLDEDDGREPIRLFEKFWIVGLRLQAELSGDFLILSNTSASRVRLDPAEVAKCKTRGALLLMLRAAAMTTRTAKATARVPLTRTVLLAGATPGMSPAQVWASVLAPGLDEYRRIASGHAVDLKPMRSSNGRIQHWSMSAGRLYGGARPVAPPRVEEPIVPPPQAIETVPPSDERKWASLVLPDAIREQVLSEFLAPEPIDEEPEPVVEKPKPEPFDIATILGALEPYPSADLPREERIRIITDQTSRGVFGNAAHLAHVRSLQATGELPPFEEDDGDREFDAEEPE